MNGNSSTTAKAERLPDAAKLAAQWKAIDWKRAEAEVNRLQVRIAKATQKKKWNTVKRLQYLLTHSYHAKLMAVKKVTTNKGSGTPGVDKRLWKTPAQKMNAASSLSDKRYRASPLRRVYIDKKGKKAKRPLGIPTIYDRAMQALYAQALDPVSEATADKRSFGFRKGRSCQDACEYIFSDLSRNYSPEWVLEGDIRGCFDNISHEWLISNIPMDKSVLKQFLKAGFVFKGELFPTEDGTPQGGVISAILANMALDGMERALAERFRTTYRSRYANKVNMVRYADDFVVTAATKEIAIEAKAVIRDFLQTRGLELSEEKTVISHTDDGFDMLGWTFRKFNGKLIVKPSKKAVKAFSAALSETVLKRGKAWRQDALIEKLNQQIRGWTNYHQSVCASTTFSHIDHVLYQLLWRWACRRHHNKGKRWIYARYWQRLGAYKRVFRTEGGKVLLRVNHTPIVRHTRVRMEASPYLEPDYFAQRRFDHGMKRLTGRFKAIWRNQNGRCYHCSLPLDTSDEREILYVVPKSEGGEDSVQNMRYVHRHCQLLYTECRSKE